MSLTISTLPSLRRGLMGSVLLLAGWLPNAMAEGERWYLQTSAYTRHFSPDPEHNNRQRLIGLEREDAGGWLWGGATFRNSFDQRSVYAYGGKAWRHDDWPVYAKLSAGLLHGYRGEYRDKIPLNRFGVAPAVIPAVGYGLGPVGVEAVLLGANAMMINVGYGFR
jgi:hypothetical protein